jgi:TrpR-related protein YerC/YecD
MKQRDVHLPGKPGVRSSRAEDVLPPLLEAFLVLKTPTEMRGFLADLCTPAELEAIADRWRVVPLLLKEAPYREIHDLTGVSVTTIGRIARALTFGAGGYRLAAERLLAAAQKKRRPR